MRETLDDLIARIEATLPDDFGWLLRQDNARGGYFANIVKGNPNLENVEKRVTFPQSHEDMYAALHLSFEQFKMSNHNA